MGTLTYIKSFLKDRDVASVTPTSRFCISRICKRIDFTEDRVIVEYGAGSGVFAEHLLPKLTSGSRLILFETNTDLFKKLKELNDSRLQLHNESVEFVDRVIGPELAGKIDCIISGIPFSFFSKKDTWRILEKSRSILKEGGSFLAYQASDHLKKPLEKVFGNVDTSFEVRNIPPMVICHSVKQKKAGPPA